MNSSVGFTSYGIVRLDGSAQRF